MYAVVRNCFDNSFLDVQCIYESAHDGVVESAGCSCDRRWQTSRNSVRLYSHLLHVYTQAMNLATICVFLVDINFCVWVK